MKAKDIYAKPVRWALSALFIVLFGYGIVTGAASGPIRPCEQGYCGKYGSLHSEAEYRHSVLWERALLSVTALAVVYTLGGWILRWRGKL